MAKQVTYNGNGNDGVNYIALTDIPNIITIEEDENQTSGYKAFFYITFDATTLSNQPDGTYAIELFGETITSVKNYENAINKNFWISNQDNTSTAASVAAALRNCQSLVANFIIENVSNTVRLTGRRQFSTDIQSNFFVTDTRTGVSVDWHLIGLTSWSDGTDPSDLTNAKVQIDIYSGDVGTYGSGDYVTTLEKICPDKTVSFNVSPVITSFAEYGRTVKWQYRAAYTTTNGKYYTLTNPDDYTNYVVVGYMVNQGQGRGLHQIEASRPMIAQNVSRGNSNPNFDNQTLLYLYGDVVPLSFYKGNTGGGQIAVKYRDSAFQTIATLATQWNSTDSLNKLHEQDLSLAISQETQSYFDRAFYIDVEIGSIGTLRYNVIKPLKAAEDYTRIYFRNSYGGKSFIDLTGKRTETRNLETKTYQKGIYDYQDIDVPNVLDIIYDNQVKYDITIKSHLFQGDGRWIYNDLLQSSKVWTYVNREEYDIIIDSVSVDELDNSNDVWEATIKYHYSMHPSIL